MITLFFNVKSTGIKACSQKMPLAVAANTRRCRPLDDLLPLDRAVLLAAPAFAFFMAGHLAVRRVRMGA